MLTRVAWNANNIANLKSRLTNFVKARTRNALEAERQVALLDRVYGKIDLTDAQALREVSPLFQAMSREVPDLSERMINAAVAVTEIPMRESPEFASHCEGITDSTLRKSVEAGGIAGQIKSTRELVGLADLAITHAFGSSGGSKAKLLKHFMHDMSGSMSGPSKPQLPLKPSIWDWFDPKNKPDLEKKIKPDLFKLILTGNETLSNIDKMYNKIISNVFEFKPFLPKEPKKVEYPKDTKAIMDELLAKYSQLLKSSTSATPKGSSAAGSLKCAELLGGR